MADGHPALDLAVRYQETAAGWLPHSWTFTQAAAGVVQFREECRVDEVALDPPVADADFRFEETPGLLIVQSAQGGSPDPKRLMAFGAENTYYRVGADGRRQEVTFAQGVEQPVASSRWAWWLLGLLGVALIGAGVWWWRR